MTMCRLLLLLLLLLLGVRRRRCVLWLALWTHQVLVLHVDEPAVACQEGWEVEHCGRT